MTAIVFGLSWLLGLVFGVQLIAAWYSIIDFNYRRRRFQSIVLSRVGICSGAIILLYYLLPSLVQAGFFEGIHFIVSVHILLIFLPNLLFYGFRKQQRKLLATFLTDRQEGA